MHMMTSSNGNIFRVTGHLCGEFTGPGEFPTQRPVTRSFGVFFYLRPNKRLSKQPWGWWFETLSWSLWRHCNDSMELWVGQFRWHEQFRGISWNSMELRERQFQWHEQFHEIPWNSMGLWVAPMSMTRAVPWNSMEPSSLVIKYRNFEVAWSLVEFEACMIPIEIE